MQEEACAAVDKEKVSSSSEYETDEEWEEERKKKQADQLKEQVLKSHRHSVFVYMIFFAQLFRTSIPINSRILSHISLGDMLH